MSESTEVFVQLGGNPADAVKQKTLVIRTPYMTDAYKQSHVNQGTATFIFDPIAGGYCTSNKPQPRSDIHLNGNYANYPKYCLDDKQIDLAKQACSETQPQLGHHHLLPVGSCPKVEVSCVDIVVGPRGSNLVNIQSENGVAECVGKSVINISITKKNITGHCALEINEANVICGELSAPETTIPQIHIINAQPMNSEAQPHSIIPALIDTTITNHQSSAITSYTGESMRSAHAPSTAIFQDPLKSPRSALLTIGNGSSHHFRFSPSLSRRPSRLQTVPEVTLACGLSEALTAPGAGGVVRVVGEVGCDTEGTQDQLHNGDKPQLFTSCVNFQIDRDQVKATGLQSHQDTTLTNSSLSSSQCQKQTPFYLTQDSTRELNTAVPHIREKAANFVVSIPTVRSQEAEELQTKLCLPGLVLEELPPQTIPTACVQTCDKHTSNGGQVLVAEEEVIELAPAPTERINASSDTVCDTDADVVDKCDVDVDEIGGTHDPRRRVSYRISTISDAGFRAWTQNSELHNRSASDAESKDDYMDKLKNVASRLKLATRRPSVQAWRDLVIGKPAHCWQNRKKNSLCDFGNVHDESEESQWSEDRRDRVSEALDWLRRELLYMREQDQSLARYLITLRHDIQQVKLARSSAVHQGIIDDAADELEEARHLAGHSDNPPEYFSTPLKQYGVTRMNINSRRFSVF